MKYSNYFKEQVFTHGQVVRREGHPVDKLHIVLEGAFEIVKTVEYVKDTTILSRKTASDLKQLLPKKQVEDGKGEKRQQGK